MSRHRSATPHQPAPAAPQPHPLEDSAENASTIAVVGATGAVGSPLVQALHNRGLAVAPISRSTGVDVRTGRGLEQALRGVETIVDVSNVVTIRRRVAVDYFARAPERLLRAAEGNRVQHYLVLSIVGIDDIDYGYYDGKRVQEGLVRSSAIPHTIVRANQFHEFAAQMLARMTFGPLAIIPVLSVCLAAVHGRDATLLWILGAGWLLFLPNAPYILTDFIHLGRSYARSGGVRPRPRRPVHDQRAARPAGSAEIEARTCADGGPVGSWPSTRARAPACRGFLGMKRRRAPAYPRAPSSPLSRRTIWKGGERRWISDAHGPRA